MSRLHNHGGPDFLSLWTRTSHWNINEFPRAETLKKQRRLTSWTKRWFFFSWNAIQKRDETKERVYFFQERDRNAKSFKNVVLSERFSLNNSNSTHISLSHCLIPSPFSLFIVFGARDFLVKNWRSTELGASLPPTLNLVSNSVFSSSIWRCCCTDVCSWTLLVATPRITPGSCDCACSKTPPVEDDLLLKLLLMAGGKRGAL